MKRYVIAVFCLFAAIVCAKALWANEMRLGFKVVAIIELAFFSSYLFWVIWMYNNNRTWSLRCLLFGHKEPLQRDGWAAFCVRCRKHSYYDDKYCNDGARWPYFNTNLFGNLYWMLRFELFSRYYDWSHRNEKLECPSCHKSSKRKLWRLGFECPKCGHEDLPF